MSTGNIDMNFPKAWPFGVLKTIHWASSLAILITLYLSPYYYSSVGFVLSVSWSFFFFSLITWICYLIGLQRQAHQFGAGFCFVPFALMDFIASILATFVFGISALICVIAIFNALNYRFSLVLTYLFSAIFCMIAGAAYGYYSILIYRACPNGNLRNLSTLVIEGDATSTIVIPGSSAGGPAGGAANINVSGGGLPVNIGGRPK